MKRKIVISLLAGLGMSLGATAQAQNAWDAVSDFNLGANPNGAWGYHWQEPAGGALFPMAAGTDCGNASVICWTRFEGNPLPQIGLNTSTGPLESGSNLAPLGVLLLHPGASGERAVVTWKAPHTTGKVRYFVNGQFQLLDFHNFHYGLSGVNVSVNVEGKVGKPPVTLTRFGQFMKFELNNCLSPGQTVSFTVDANGNYANDLTALKVGILRSREFDETVPEQRAACPG